MSIVRIFDITYVLFPGSCILLLVALEYRDRRLRRAQSRRLIQLAEAYLASQSGS